MIKQILIAATTGLCIMQSSAQAQVSKADTITLSEVVVEHPTEKPLQEQPVGMLRLDVPLKHLPMTVSRLDRNTLSRKHITSMEEAIGFLPGVVMQSNQLGAFQRYSIRGSNDIAIAYDGIRDERANTNTVPFADLSAIESIEVIKGPAAIMAGHSTMGGIINIVRRKPTDKFTGHGEMTYGSWKHKDASLSFSGPIAGPLRYRAHAFFSQADGYRKVNSDRLSGLFALSAQLTPRAYWEASVNGSDDSYTTDIGGAPTMPADIYYAGTDRVYLPSGSRNPLCDYERNYNDLANNHMRRRLIDFATTFSYEIAPWLKLRERLAYTHSHLDYACVENLTYVTSATNPDGRYKYEYTNPRNKRVYYTNLDSMITGTPLCFNPVHTTWANTLDLNGRLSTGRVVHTYTLGWNASWFDFTQYNGYQADDVWGPGVGEVISVADPNPVRDWWQSKVSAANISRYSQQAVYLTDVIDLGEHWKGMLSGRYDSYKYKRATATIADGRQHYDKADRTPWNRVSTSAFTYRAGAVYLPRPDLSVYASAASFFKPYNTFYNPNYIYYDSNGHEFKPDMEGGEVYRPERGTQMEAGIRFEHRIFEVNASVFYMRRTNVVTNVGQMPVEENGEQINKTVQAQVGRYSSHGIDMDLTVHPWSTLRITAGAAWTDYRRRASNMDWAVGLPWVTMDESGQINLKATGVPHVTFYTFADYTVATGPLRSLSFHLSGRYTGRIYRDVTNNVYDSPTYIVDGGIQYTLHRHITLGITVRNILNHRYFTSATRMAPPANFMATVAYDI